MLFVFGSHLSTLPTVGLNYLMSGKESVDLSSVIEALQSYLLCGDLAISLRIRSQLQGAWSRWIFLETRRFE